MWEKKKAICATNLLGTQLRYIYTLVKIMLSNKYDIICI